MQRAEFGFLTLGLVLLAAAVLSVPIARRLRLSAIVASPDGTYLAESSSKGRGFDSADTLQGAASTIIRRVSDWQVVKSLDETISRRQMNYLLPSAPHGPADQLHSPELVEAAARK